MDCGMEGGGALIVCDRLAQDRMRWIFPQNLRFQFFEARGKKTESIFELTEKINQEMKLFVDFF